MLKKLREDLKSVSTKDRAKGCQRFFKTGKGEYGEGDVFIGARVPDCRKIAKKYKELSFIDLKELILSLIHEERLIALFILVNKYEKGDLKMREKVFKFYLKNKKGINNWDLVDSSAHKILGRWISENKKEFPLLKKLAKSENLWDRRISIIATAWFIKMGDFKPTFQIAKILLRDKEDLIHKAVGWMLREVGKKDKVGEVMFLEKHKDEMPRTMLRYAIERFPLEERRYFLSRS